VSDHATSGDRTDQGLARLEAQIAAGNVPDAAIVELGTNDALQDRSLAGVEADLRSILEIFDGTGTDVLLAGTHGFFPGRGGYDSPTLIDDFEAIFPRLASEFGVDLYPLFLDGVLDDQGRYTFDDLHPNVEGVDLIVDRMLPQVATLVRDAGAGSIGSEPDSAGDPLQLADGTISLWFAADDLTGQQGLLSKDAGNFGDGGHISIGLDGNALNLRLQSTAASYELTSGTGAVTVGDAHHIAVTFGGTGLKLYLDGTLVASDGYTGGLVGNEEPLVLGARTWKSNAGLADNLEGFFDGTIDELAIFDVALDANTIAGLHDAGAASLDQLIATGDQPAA
jgi:hypothetical protein